jgi:hypothetical protein
MMGLTAKKDQYLSEEGSEPNAGVQIMQSTSQTDCMVQNPLNQ